MTKTIETYKTYLNNLDKTAPYAISKGIAFYKGLFSDCPDVRIRDEMFWMLWDFYVDVMVKARSHPVIKDYIDHLNNDKVSSSSITVHSDHHMTVGDVYVQDVPMPMHIREIFNDNGFHVYQNEGHYYLYLEPGFLFNQLSSYLSEASQEYLREEAINDKEGFLNDMALTISWERLGERIIFWEKFLRKHSEFIKKTWVESGLYLYLAVFFIGVDNSGPFGVCSNDEIGTLKPDLRTAYEKYINNYYPEFPSAVAVKKYYEILKRNDFTNKQEVEAFLKKNIYYDKEIKRWVVTCST